MRMSLEERDELVADLLDDDGSGNEISPSTSASREEPVIIMENQNAVTGVEKNKKKCLRSSSSLSLDGVIKNRRRQCSFKGHEQASSSSGSPSPTQASTVSTSASASAYESASGTEDAEDEELSDHSSRVWEQLLRGREKKPNFAPSSSSRGDKKRHTTDSDSPGSEEKRCKDENTWYPSSSSTSSAHSVSEHHLSIFVPNASLDLESALALRATCHVANQVVDRDRQSWIRRLDADFPSRRGETMDLLSVYANAHMRYILFRHLHKCESQWQNLEGSGCLYMSWTWFCSRIIRRVSPQMYDQSRKRAVAGGNHDVGTADTPRIVRLRDPSISVPAEFHTSVSKSLDKLCEWDWFLVYNQLATELRLRAKVLCSNIEVPDIDEDFNMDEALLYLPLWNSSSRKGPRLSGVRNFEKPEAFLESILSAHYDFEDIGRMLEETASALDVCIENDRAQPERSQVMPIRELVRTAFLAGVIFDSLIQTAFVWALYSTIHRAAKGESVELLRDVSEMVKEIHIKGDIADHLEWREQPTWFGECVVTPLKCARRKFHGSDAKANFFR